MKNRQHKPKAAFLSFSGRSYQRLCRRLYRRHWGWSAGIGLGLLQVAIALSPQLAKPTQAAEQITFSLGATIERTISLESLKIYAEEGRITDELAPYVRYLNNVDPSTLDTVRSLLTQRIDVDVMTVSQFAYTPQGEYVLDEAGKVFRTGARLSGGKGLRAAAILAAADDGSGLTVLNVIENFPTPMLRIDLRQGFAIASQASDSFNQSGAALNLVEQISLQTTTETYPSGPEAVLLDQLTARGPFEVSQVTTLVKASVAPVDVYVPRSPTTFFNERVLPAEGPFAGSAEGLAAMPTVIISHGFGNERKTYRYLAEFLATHGFAVISVEHPGSSADQFNALVSGRTSMVVPDDEFTRRPELISQVLNELEIRAASDKTFAQIDFNNVGLIGQSFGGYTALAVAGAPINLASLRANCPPSEFSLNVVVLLQCQAVNLAPLGVDRLDFSDPRIKAVVAINPMTSLIFGPESMSEIAVPVLMMAASNDTVAPALPEQVVPFTWLTTPERYLMMMDGGTHFSTIAVTGEEAFSLPPAIFGPVPDAAQGYAQVMSLAFLSRYLKGDSRYQPVLTSGFTARLSEPEMPLSIISNLDPEQLAQQLKLAAEGNLPARQTVERTLDEMMAREALQEK